MPNRFEKAIRYMGKEGDKDLGTLLNGTLDLNQRIAIVPGMLDQGGNYNKDILLYLQNQVFDGLATVSVKPLSSGAAELTHTFSYNRGVEETILLVLDPRDTHSRFYDQKVATFVLEALHQGGMLQQDVYEQAQIAMGIIPESQRRGIPINRRNGTNSRSSGPTPQPVNPNMVRNERSAPQLPIPIKRSGAVDQSRRMINPAANAAGEEKRSRIGCLLALLPAACIGLGLLGSRINDNGKKDGTEPQPPTATLVVDSGGASTPVSGGGGGAGERGGNADGSDRDAGGGGGDIDPGVTIVATGGVVEPTDYAYQTMTPVPSTPVMVYSSNNAESGSGGGRIVPQDLNVMNPPTNTPRASGIANPSENPGQTNHDPFVPLGTVGSVPAYLPTATRESGALPMPTLSPQQLEDMSPFEFIELCQKYPTIHPNCRP